MANGLKSAPIGVFDSGIGGLSVMAELLQTVPGEDIIYFGDTARVPYGTKSDRAIISFSREITRFLIRQGAKVIIIACNSASAAALPLLREEFDLPVFGVIEPGADAAARRTKNRRIGIIGTTATIHSRAYQRVLEKIAPDTQPFSRACPLFVPLVEEGMVDHPITWQTAEHYLLPVREAEVDTLILGCTHYPLLRAVIQDTMGAEVTLVDSARETARFVAAQLSERNLLNPSLSEGYRKYFLSDQSPNFQRVGSLFLDGFVNNLTVVDVESDTFRG
ncbi:MAG: glutamate racemase [Candidatus Delongbacteria bacterium]|nr:glutamate racemase [bacterium]MBL7033203.1 glutamate racemase [Candidatus Delongbacteria bacterium]